MQRIDRLVARARRENHDMKEQLETHAGELDHAARLKNVVTDLRARVDAQLEENDLLEKLTARQVEQLAQLGLSAAQKRELDRLRNQKEEMQEQLRGCTQRANELACKWAKAEISIADDRELQDAPDGPFGNKGGLYIESRIQIVEGKDGVTVTSPTITTPLDGVPPPFLAGHYMKVLCPFAS